MSKAFTDDLTEDARSARMRALASYLTKGEGWSLLAEEFEQDLTFSALEEKWEDASEDLSESENPAGRLAANYAGAAFRDAKYMSAGRNYILKLGHHNAFRELYEGGRIAADNDTIWEDEDG